MSVCQDNAVYDDYDPMKPLHVTHGIKSNIFISNVKIITNSEKKRFNI